VTFTKIPLPEPRNVSPCGLGAGSGGKIWFTDPFFLQAGYVAPDGSITKFKLVDPESNTVFSGTAKTNDFGIASIDWELPDSTELGPYGLQVSLSNSDRYGSAQEMTNVRVSRYDLPNFTVAAQPDRSYYLPGPERIDCDIRQIPVRERTDPRRGETGS